ncbi:hypothetical protein OFO10_06065 [Campylobacter sp. VBCF_06 NA8]|uniref:hypothetical protein n=1 Tax=Campylobacter sp. VBCF_06 NA8 TaxID=2983822 RepID=UPI0022E9A93E|nr:hypothetical protein [Campylobacter sp. VBCF_06 NA8]MDA3046720.1 hypothetical protein [Campylobacter sp. VBCF_06 NA8]
MEIITKEGKRFYRVRKFVEMFGDQFEGVSRESIEVCKSLIKNKIKKRQPLSAKDEALKECFLKDGKDLYVREDYCQIKYIPRFKKELEEAYFEISELLSIRSDHEIARLIAPFAISAKFRTTYDSVYRKIIIIYNYLRDFKLSNGETNEAMYLALMECIKVAKEKNIKDPRILSAAVNGYYIIESKIVLHKKEIWGDEYHIQAYNPRLSKAKKEAL